MGRFARAFYQMHAESVLRLQESNLLLFLLRRFALKVQLVLLNRCSLIHTVDSAVNPLALPACLHLYSFAMLSLIHI